MDTRAQPSVVVTVPTPAIYQGKPQVPAYLAQPPFTVTATLGPSAIHAEPPPKPKPRPSGGGYISNGGDWHARWTVDTLPAPADFSGGFYWLGDPSSADGTAGIRAGARQWGPDPGTPSAPSWHSFFPFKPSVVTARHYLYGGDYVEHPKGVNFNAHFIEHMWMDWGSAKKQPFTWLIAAMPTAFPHRTYEHHILDSGRNPKAVGFPALTAAQVNVSRRINDGLAYRSMLTATESHLAICARPKNGGPGTVRCNVPGGLRPKMYIACFNGNKSQVGQWGPGSRHLRTGHVDNGTAQAHRFNVLGRRNGVISQDGASHLLVFEILYWSRVLTHAELETQYEQLSSRHQFNRYRTD